MSEETKIELKPCPFCGGEANLVCLPPKDQCSMSRYFVHCRKCYSSQCHESWTNPASMWWGADYAIKAWNRRVSEERLPQGIQNQIDDAKEVWAAGRAFDQRDRERDPSLSLAKSTAQQVLDFFTSRSPCRVVVCLSTRAALDKFFVDLREISHKGRRTDLAHGTLKVVKPPNDHVSYIIGFVDTPERRESLLGHYVAYNVNDIARTMCVIDDGASDELVTAIKTWAEILLTHDGDDDAKEGNDGGDGCSDTPTIVR